MPEQRSVIERARDAALEPYTDAPQTTDEWLYALSLGADEALRVVVEHLIDVSKTRGDSHAVTELYRLEVELCPEETCS